MWKTVEMFELVYPLTSRILHYLPPIHSLDRALWQIRMRTGKKRGIKRTMRKAVSLVENPEMRESGHILFGVLAVREGSGDALRNVFAGVSDAALIRHALPEATKVFAASDPDRAKTLLRDGLAAWRKSAPACRLSLATTCAYLGDADSVELLTADLRHPGTDALLRMFAEQQRVARKLGVSTDYVSVRKAACNIGGDGQSMNKAEGGGSRNSNSGGQVQIGLLEGQGSAMSMETSVETVSVDRNIPLAAAVEGTIWLPVSGAFGHRAYPTQFGCSFDFPFPGNVRPLFIALHIADPESLDDESLAWLRRFAPIGCQDLSTVRLLRGAGVKAFVSDFPDEKCPQPLLDAIHEGQTEAKIYALWRNLAAPAMTRTDAMIAEQNAKYPLPEVSLADFDLDSVPVQTFGPASEPDGSAVHLLFTFDENFADIFPGTFEGVWRHWKSSHCPVDENAHSALPATTQRHSRVNPPEGRPLVVHVFGRGLNAGMFEQWVAQFPGVHFTWRDLSNFAYANDYPTTRITVSSWDSMLAPALLPDLEKIVYLDTDVLVRADISELFDTELGDASFAARQNKADVKTGAGEIRKYDHDSRFTEEKRETLRNAYFNNGSTKFEAFNAGVLVMNLAVMRRERAMEQTLALVQACWVGDQTAQNLYARGRWVRLADKWNIYPRTELPENPAIVHFTGPEKPWTDIPRLFRQEWRENAASAQARIRRSVPRSAEVPLGK